MAKKIQFTNPYKSSSGTSSKSTSSSGTSSNKGYDPNKDYSLAIKNAASDSERLQLQQERQNKINDKYGGVDPYRGTSDIMGTGKSSAVSGGGSSSGSVGTSYTRPSTGGSSYGSGGSSYTPAVDYHQQAKDAAARGDWSAVGKALADRQAKIDAQGGNNRGVTNQQILDQLRSQYGGSYDSLSGGRQDYVNLNAGARLPYNTSYGATGEVYKDRGWQQGTDYLAEAQRLAQAGDLDGAYDALMRRGFKMADTGSLGGGTSQDQAYAQIHQLYNQSPAAREQYLNEVSVNRQRLAEHPTQFGTGTNPSLANRRFVSQDGQYLIIYDQNGTPSVALPNKETYTRYSPEEIALMSQYYNGDENTDFAELYRQIHNNQVVRTGTGRLVDQSGNYASGTPIQPVSARNWTGLPQTDRYKDKAALQAILEQINAGTDYAGGSSQVPIDQRAQYLASLPTGSGGYGASSGSYGGGSGGGYLDYGSGGTDLAAYLRQAYAENLNAQLAGLRAAYEQNLAGYQAHDDLIAQAYADQRNQAAAQNDLQRMYMAEMGGMQGLNTGATGQLALAQSAAYQNSLAKLLAAESQDRAENDLALRQLTAQYQGDLVSAQAQSSAGLADALYNEYIRQTQEAQENQRWQAQLAYQQQQDAWDRQKWQTQWDYGIQADQRDSAYNLAATLLKNGVLPDSATLAAAGISQADAANLLRAYQTPMTGTSRSTSKIGNGKPNMTYAQIMSAIESGQVTDAVKSGYDYYMGSGSYDQFYGGVDISGLDTNQIANTHYGDFVRISRPDGQTVAASWDTVAKDAANGSISAKSNGDGTYTLYYTK